MLLDKQVRLFQKKILDFYSENKRNLIWRDCDNPYFVFVSEFMLQQTQVSRVKEKFVPFVTRFATISDLAHASFLEVLSCWQGLGYNRRAKYIHQAAQTIVEKYGGVIPDTIAELRLITGIGPYTAAAIVTFCCNKPEIFIETNIRTVFLHEFFFNKSNVHDSCIRSLVAQTIDQKNPRSWYYALMDYGSYLKRTKKNPSQQSAHYTKQTSFLGSRRQLRGSIIAFLIKHGPTNYQCLKTCISDDIRFDEVITSLQQEEMVDVIGDSIGIKNTIRNKL